MFSKSFSFCTSLRSTLNARKNFTYKRSAFRHYTELIHSDQHENIQTQKLVSQSERDLGNITEKEIETAIETTQPDFLNTENSVPVSDLSIFKVIPDLELGLKIMKEKSKVFVALDLEYWEKNNSCLTEIGISIFDPNLDYNYFPTIRSSHYIVKENVNRINSDYVPNNKFRFAFGKSLTLKMTDCKSAVNQILDHYASQDKLVFIGHSVAGDIKMLKARGFNIPENYEVIDTFKIWNSSQQRGFGSLGGLLEYFKIDAGLLHNAGNDAYFNMELLLKMLDPAVRKRLELDIKKDRTNLISPFGTINKKGKKKSRKTKSPSAEELISWSVENMVRE